MNAKRIAMWSGPRNLSTALMRSFSSREDCSVRDEPFYAAYLFYSGSDHPLRERIIKYYDTDPNKVAKSCVRGKCTKPLEYQKHMTHHMLPAFDRKFIHGLANAFLVRSPRKVIKSFGEKMGEFDILELGIIQQVEIFNLISQKTGVAPPVIDADDLCKKPQEGLAALCTSLKIDFSTKMLSWPAGRHFDDGIWGQYWYSSVYQSKGFKAPRTKTFRLNSFAKKMEEKVKPYFEQLNGHKILF